MTPAGVAEYRRRWSVPPPGTDQAGAGPKLIEPPAEAPTSGPDIQSWMTDEELVWLYETGREMTSIVEVGCWKERASQALCSSGCPVVYAVDTFQGSGQDQNVFAPLRGGVSFAEFRDKILTQFTNIVLKRMGSAEAARDFEDRSADMVFIDGPREYEFVSETVALWTPKSRRLVAGHDRQHAGVRKAINEYFGREPDQTVGAIWAYRV